MVLSKAYRHEVMTHKLVPEVWLGKQEDPVVRGCTIGKIIEVQE